MVKSVNLQENFQYSAPQGLVSVSLTQDQTHMHDISGRVDNIEHNKTILNEQERSIAELEEQHAEIIDNNPDTNAGDPTRTLVANVIETAGIALISTMNPAMAAAVGGYAIASAIQQAHKAFNDVREADSVKSARHEGQSEFTKTDTDNESSWTPSYSANDESYAQTPAPVPRNIMDTQSLMDFDSARNVMQDLADADGLKITIDQAKMNLAQQQNYLGIAEQNTSNAFNFRDADNDQTYQDTFGFAATNIIRDRLAKGGTGTILGDNMAKGPELSEDLKIMMSGPSPMGSVA